MNRHSSSSPNLAERRKHSRIRSRFTIVNVLRLAWVAAVIWCEVGAFFSSLWGCSWPVIEHPDPAIRPTHVLLVADPHMLDEQFHLDRHPWFSSWTRKLVHYNLRKSWNAVSRLNPDAMFVLGDMLDNGRGVMTDEEYRRYHALYKSTFRLPNSAPVYHLPGNHDVGLGSRRGFSPQARRRFRQHFGPEQQLVNFGNHSFILLDAPGLVDEDYKRYAAEVDFEDWKGSTNGPIAFVHGFENNPPPNPVVLLSHIPLARPDTASCGPHREHLKPIRRGAGFGYQNELGKFTTNFIFQCIKPVAIFSGDDHDHCDYTHAKTGNPIREVTVRSFSMGMGVRKPGFQLLSLVPKSLDTPDAPTIADRACVLPDQVWMYTWVYFSLSLVTIACIGYLNFSNNHRLTLTGSGRVPKEPSPLKLTGLGTSTFPSSPRLTSRSQLSLRKTSLGVMSPHGSRPSTPIFSPLHSPLLFSEMDEENAIYSSPVVSDSHLPSTLSHNLFSDDTAGGDDEAESDEGMALPTYTPSSGSITPRRKGSGWKQHGSNYDSPAHAWVPDSLKGTNLKSWTKLISRVLLRRGGPRSTSNEGWAIRVLKDIGRTAWPPAVVSLIIWWRLSL